MKVFAGVPYLYRATCSRVVDGDTLDCTVDLGFRVFSRQRFRLLDIDTPELRSRDEAERVRARDAALFAARWLTLSPEGGISPDGRGGWHVGDPAPLLVSSRKTGKYGRWLARIYRETDGANLTADLRSAGFAE